MSSIFAIGTDSIQNFISYLDAKEFIALTSTCKCLHNLKLTDIVPSVAEWLTFHDPNWYERFSKRIQQLPAVSFFKTTTLLHPAKHPQLTIQSLQPILRQSQYKNFNPSYQRSIAEHPKQFIHAFGSYLQQNSNIQVIPLEVILMLSKTWFAAFDYFKTDLCQHLSDETTLNGLLSHRGYLLKYAPEELQNSETLRRCAYRDNPYWRYLFEQIIPEGTEDATLLKNACRAYPQLCNHLPPTIFSSPSICNELITKYPYFIERFPAAIASNTKVLTTFVTALKEWPDTYTKSSCVDELPLGLGTKVPETIIRELLQISSKVFLRAPESIRNDQSYILELATLHPDISRYCPQALQQDADFCFKILQANQASWYAISSHTPAIYADTRFLRFAREHGMHSFANDIVRYNNIHCCQQFCIPIPLPCLRHIPALFDALRIFSQDLMDDDDD